MEQFEKWLSEICRYGDAMDFVNWEGAEGSPGGWGCRVKIYTRNHIYSIKAKVDADGHNYLGCGVSTRKRRAGEDWGRGNDLADGPFDRETWDKIKNNIISYELVKVVKGVRKDAKGTEVVETVETAIPSTI